MATVAQVEANRRNAKKSTGPTTEEGKSRARFNALDHGCRARILVLPTESQENYEATARDWKLSLQPRNPLEDFLIEQLGAIAWQTKRVDRAHTARLTSRIYNAERDEIAQEHEHALELGQRLFGNVAEPAAEERTALGISPRDSGADHPSRLIVRLEATGAGCEWLLGQWARLHSLLEEGLTWQTADKHKAVRLLGRLPVEAVDDISTACVYLASARLEDNECAPFRDVLDELRPEDVAGYEARLTGRHFSRLAPRDAATARQTLMEMASQAIESLTDNVKIYRELAELDAATAPERLSFDTTADGERLRRYALAHHRAWFRTFDLFTKIRRGDPDLTFATMIGSLPDHRPEPQTTIALDAVVAAPAVIAAPAVVSPLAVVSEEPATPAVPVNTPATASDPPDNDNAPNEPNFSVHVNKTQRLDAAASQINPPHVPKPTASVGGTGRMVGKRPLASLGSRPLGEGLGRQRTLLNLSSIFGTENPL